MHITYLRLLLNNLTENWKTQGGFGLRDSNAIRTNHNCLQQYCKLKLFRNKSPGNQNTLGPTQSHNLVGWRTSLETCSEIIAIR